MILNTIMMVAKGINWYLTLWWGWPRLCEGCLVTVVSMTKIVCKWYLATVVTMHMMLIRKMKGVSSVLIFLKLISLANIRRLMTLMRFISFGDYLLATDSEKGKYWLVIPKEWDKLMIPREEYLGIKWELIYKEMVFANRWVVLRFSIWNYSWQMR